MALRPHAPRPPSRNERRLREKAYHRAVSRIRSRLAAERHAGAGFEVDKLLREFSLKLNDRLRANGWDGVMPFSWGTLDAFFSDDDEDGLPYLTLRHERDHAFSANDFLDWATTSPPQDKGLARLRSLPEGDVHSFTVLGKPGDLAFATRDGRDFVLSGASMVRHGDRLAWVLVGGLTADLDVETGKLRETYLGDGVRSEALWDGAPELTDQRICAEPLPGADGLWRTIAYGNFDLARGRHASRTYATDNGDVYGLVTDSPDAVLRQGQDVPDEGGMATMEHFAELLETNAAVFEMAEAAFMLPSYFDVRIDLVRTEPRATAIARGEMPPRDRARVLHAPAGDRRPFRMVRTLDVEAPPVTSAGRRSYTPPSHSVALDGFYRRIDPRSVGRDEDGGPILGRTWVKGHMRWRDRPARAEPILVKASVAAARERAAELVANDLASPAP